MPEISSTLLPVFCVFLWIILTLFIFFIKNRVELICRKINDRRAEKDSQKLFQSENQEKHEFGKKFTGFCRKTKIKLYALVSNLNVLGSLLVSQCGFLIFMIRESFAFRQTGLTLISMPRNWNLKPKAKKIKAFLGGFSFSRKEKEMDKEMDAEIIQRLEKRRLGLSEESKKEKKMAGFTSDAIKGMRLKLEKTEPNKKNDFWEFSVIAIVNFANGNPLVDVEVQFNLHGPEEEEEVLSTDSEGRIVKDYSLRKNGKYTIEAFVVGSSAVRQKVTVELKDEKKKLPKDLEVRAVGDDNGSYFIIATVIGEEGIGLKGYKTVLLRPGQMDSQPGIEDKDSVGVFNFKNVQVTALLEEITIVVLGTNLNKIIRLRGPRKPKAMVSQPNPDELKNIFKAFWSGIKK